MKVNKAYLCVIFFFFKAEDGIRDLVRSRGLGDVYKRQEHPDARMVMLVVIPAEKLFAVSGRVFEAVEPGGPVRPVLQRFERGLRVGIVVGHPRS